MKRLILIMMGIAGLASAHGQSAQISGLIRDSETLEAVAGAVVVLEGTVYGALTNELGYYYMAAPDSGSFTLSTSMIGYERTAKTITMARNAKVEVHFYIKTLEFTSPTLPYTGKSTRKTTTTIAEGPPKPEKFPF